MATANLDGKPSGQYEKVLIVEDVYQAVLEAVEDKTVEMGNEKFGAKPKIILKWKLTSGLETKTIPQFVAPTVTKGSGSFQSSNLYVMIEKANLLETYKATMPSAGDFPDEKLIEFIKKNLVGKVAKVLVKNTKGDQPYSLVKEIVNFQGVNAEKVNTALPKA
jgi:DNA repair exonuclease SbcCD nuclease subunit